MENMHENIKSMLNIAKKYLKYSYAPYSKINVVAIVETERGYFVGVNIENSSYGLTICAERVAIFKAISEGAKNFYRILIYSPQVMPYPCGACRQVMSEFCSPNFEIIIATNRKPILIFTLGELLPHSFRIENR